MTSRTDSRIRSTPSPARKASSSSDTIDWDNAIGGNLLVGTWRYTPRIPPMAPPLRQPHRLSKTQHSQDSHARLPTLAAPFLRLLAHRACSPPTSSLRADDEACPLAPPQHSGRDCRRSQPG